MTTEKNTSLCVLGEHDCFFYKVENMGMLKGEAGGDVMVGAQDDGTMLFEVLSAIPGSDTLHFTMTLEHLEALYEAAKARRINDAADRYLAAQGVGNPSNVVYPDERNN